MKADCIINESKFLLTPETYTQEQWHKIFGILKEKFLLLHKENERLKEERQNINNRNCNQRMANKKLMEDIERLRTNLKTHKRRRKKQTHKKNIYKSRIDKALDKLYCYGEIFDGKILQEFQKEMENILKGEDE